MREQITLDPVDRVEIITLYENLVDQTAPGGVWWSAFDPGRATRLSRHC
jgi:hypothetical protein